jgi:hypothetical protein
MHRASWGGRPSLLKRGSAGGGRKVGKGMGVEEGKGYIRHFNFLLFLAFECPKCLHNAMEGALHYDNPSTCTMTHCFNS